MTTDPLSLAASSGRLDATGIYDVDLAGATTISRGDDVSDAFGLGRDDFFKLFLAQLKNQDPTQPLDDKQFLAQLAQFSLIDTLNEVRAAMGGTQLAQASALLGRHVEGLAADGTSVAGVVDRIVQDAGAISLLIGDRMLRPDDVTRVTNPAT